MKLATTFFVTFLACLISSAAFAQAPPPAQGPPPVPPPDQGKFISVTISPLHLLTPVVEVTGEFAPLRKIGVAGILGVGSIAVEDAFGEQSSFTVFEVGAQGNYYVIGDFDHGMQLGLKHSSSMSPVKM